MSCWYYYLFCIIFYFLLTFLRREKRFVWHLFYLFVILCFMNKFGIQGLALFYYLAFCIWIISIYVWPLEFAFLICIITKKAFSFTNLGLFYRLRTHLFCFIRNILFLFNNGILNKRNLFNYILGFWLLFRAIHT